MVYTKLTWGNNAECFFSFYALFNKFGNRHNDFDPLLISRYSRKYCSSCYKETAPFKMITRPSSEDKWNEYQ